MNRGITLIETVLYLALFSILLVTALPLLIDLNHWQSKQEISADSFTEYVFVEAKIRDLLRRATYVATPALGATSELLEVDVGTGGNQQRIKIKRNFTDGSFVLETEDEVAELFNSTSTQISNLIFYRPRAGVGVTSLEKILFSVRVNGFEYGTSTYILSPQ